MPSATILHSRDKKWHWTVSVEKSPNRGPGAVLSRWLKKEAETLPVMGIMPRKTSLVLVAGFSTS